jgi:predicted ribosomally synthesized peptide with SipW-like signal peptide
MYKKIFMSLGAIVFVSALSLGATGAFFNDTETSTGNTFTAGAIDLKVDSVQHYNGNVCLADTQGVYHWTGNSLYPVPGTPCDGTWAQTDLTGFAYKFFNFGDVKPGDEGENTVSLHIDNNPAWACVNITTTANNENTNTQPEINAGDTSTTTGELAQNVQVFSWLDNASTSPAVPGDNIWQAEETPLAGPISLSSIVGGGTNLTLADGGSGSALPPGSTSYIGLAWCAGSMTAVSGVITCDGGTMGNQSQTDSAVADVTFTVEQERNNAKFRCPVNG